MWLAILTMYVTIFKRLFLGLNAISFPSSSLFWLPDWQVPDNFCSAYVVPGFQINVSQAVDHEPSCNKGNNFSFHFQLIFICFKSYSWFSTGPPLKHVALSIML